MKKQNPNFSNPFPNVPATYKGKKGELCVLIDVVPKLTEDCKPDYQEGKAIVYGVTTGKLSRMDISTFSEEIEKKNLSLLVSRKNP